MCESNDLRPFHVQPAITVLKSKRFASITLETINDVVLAIVGWNHLRPNQKRNMQKKHHYR